MLGKINKQQTTIVVTRSTEEALKGGGKEGRRGERYAEGAKTYEGREGTEGEREEARVGGGVRSLQRKVETVKHNDDDVFTSFLP